MARFDGKRILITGGTRGIGLAGAQHIVAEGGAVVVTGRDAARVAAVEARLGTGAQGLVNDAADPDAAAALAAAVSPLGRLDGLWLNAAVAVLAPPEAVDAESFDAMMAVNVRGPMLQLARLSAQLKPGAAVVVTASSSAYEGAAATGLYAASKSALIGAARSWATALAPRGIRVNVLVPGPIDTDFRAFLPEAARVRTVRHRSGAARPRRHRRGGGGRGAVPALRRRLLRHRQPICGRRRSAAALSRDAIVREILPTPGGGSGERRSDDTCLYKGCDQYGSNPV